MFDRKLNDGTLRRLATRSEEPIHDVLRVWCESRFANESPETPYSSSTLSRTVGKEEVDSYGQMQSGQFCLGVEVLTGWMKGRVSTEVPILTESLELGSAEGIEEFETFGNFEHLGFEVLRNLDAVRGPGPPVVATKRSE